MWKLNLLAYYYFIYDVVIFFALNTKMIGQNKKKIIKKNKK